VKVKLVAYVRVSEKSENPENQKLAIFEWTSRNGHQVVEVCEDIGVSGALPPKDRPGFQRALKALERADGLIVYALDRIARSLTELVEVVREIEGRGKLVISVRESWLQDLNPKMRSLIIAILGWAGEMEREFIRERTRLALMRLKAQGKRIGRPPKMSEEKAVAAIRLVGEGYTLKEAARVIGVGYTTLAKFIMERDHLRALYYEVKARMKRTREKRGEKEESMLTKE
jgi:DNA invertase Pin-like site-specific DNA recombinase